MNGNRFRIYKINKYNYVLIRQNIITDCSLIASSDIHTDIYRFLCQLSPANIVDLNNNNNPHTITKAHIIDRSKNKHQMFSVMYCF